METLRVWRTPPGIKAEEIDYLSDFVFDYSWYKGSTYWVIKSPYDYSKNFLKIQVNILERYAGKPFRTFPANKQEDLYAIYKCGSNLNINCYLVGDPRPHRFIEINPSKITWRPDKVWQM